MMIENPKKKQKQSDPQWEKQKQVIINESLYLKNNAQANSRLREQITKQSYADSVVQQNINNKILDLKNSAMMLAKNLENEKRKNLELQAIIKHMKYVMEESKKKQATYRDDLNYESVDNLSRKVLFSKMKIKKMEYDLDQVNSKSNHLSSKNKVKKNEVDTYRTQRVIDSSIFLKIEKQLIESEMQFKKLSIQKIKSEKQYQKNLNNYVKMKNDIGKQEVKFTRTQQKPQSQQQDQFFINAPQINHATKFTDLDTIDPKRRRYSATSKRMNSVHQVKKQKSYEQQFAVKKIFMATGLNSSSSLVSHFQNIGQINEKLYKQLNQASDSVAEVKSKIENLQKIKDRKKINYYQGQPKLTKSQVQYFRAKNLEELIKQEEFSYQYEHEQIGKFLTSKSLSDFEKLLEVSYDGIVSDDNLNSMEQKFKELETKLSPFLSKGQISHEQCEESSSIAKEQNIEQLISRIKRIQESEKVMSRNDFKDEYEKVKKHGHKTRQPKKKTTLLKKN